MIGPNYNRVKPDGWENCADPIYGIFGAADGVYCAACGMIQPEWAGVFAGITIIKMCSTCLDEGLPRNSVMIESEGPERLAYSRLEGDTLSVWCKQVSGDGEWYEWWTMDIRQFEAEFGIKLESEEE